MRLSIHAVGRMKAGPERELADRYLGRLAKAGPAVGLEFSGVAEIAESRARDVDERRREEWSSLAAHRADAALVLLDERGGNPSSQELAAAIARLRDDGRRHLVLAIGGPDGHDASARRAADLVVSFGAQTWPHQLVRVMLAEQLYRAATILAGHPYHRA